MVKSFNDVLDMSTKNKVDVARLATFISSAGGG
jgi:hypothetical protein